MKPAIRAPIPPRIVENGGRRRPKQHRVRHSDIMEDYLDEVEEMEEDSPKPEVKDVHRNNNNS